MLSKLSKTYHDNNIRDVNSFEIPEFVRKREIKSAVKKKDRKPNKKIKVNSSLDYWSKEDIRILIEQLLKHGRHASKIEPFITTKNKVQITKKLSQISCSVQKYFDYLPDQN